MAFGDTRFLQRRRKLSAELAGKRIDAYLVTDPINIRYLSGFSGSNGALLVNKNLTASIATDGRYTTQIAQEVPDIEQRLPAIAPRPCWIRFLEERASALTRTRSPSLPLRS